jgi:hypothetical protein
MFFPPALNNRPGGGVEACVTENHETMKKLITAIAIGAFAFVLLALVKAPLVYVLPALGGLGCFLTYRKLKA